MPTDTLTQPPTAVVPTTQGLHERALRNLGRAGRWRPAEFVFWALAAATFFFLPDQHLLLGEIAILGLFALSLDLILGYAGIVSLGHGVFFGVGAYVAGLVSIHMTGEPITGLVLGGVAAAIVGLATAPLLLLRASDLTRLMVTLGIAMLFYEAANKAAWLTGGADGLQGIWINPIFGRFDFDLMGTTSYAYALVVTFLLFLVARRIVTSPFGLSLAAIRDNPMRASTIGIPVGKRLVAIYTISALYAGIAGALLAQTTMFVSLDVLAFHRSADVLLVLVLGGVGYLYGGLIGAIVFKLLQDTLSTLTPQYWMFWLGLILVVIVLIGRERITSAPATLWNRVRGMGK
jgi:branched-chain amino acid transport system permease protein